MLYELHELQHTSVSSLRAWAETAAHLYGSPFSPLSYTPAGRIISASSEVFLRTTQRYEKPVFGIDHVEVSGQLYTVVEETVLDFPFCHLKRFTKVGMNTAQPKVLIVAPLSGHYATLLRDTVRTFVKDFEVWVTDWVDAKLVPLSHGPFGFDDYVRYIQEIIRFIGSDTHIVSVCQPTVPVLVAVSLMSAHQEPLVPKSMVMMGGPIDTRKNPTTVNNFAKSHPLSWFESRVIYRVPVKYPGYLRQVYPGFLQHAGFVAMNPGRHINSHQEFFYQLVRGDGENANVHRNFYDEYNAVMDLPAEYYLETLDRVFHRHALAEGTLTSCGELVRPDAITKTALLTVEGELDDISGNGQTMAAHELCGSIPEQHRQYLVAKDVGHYGIFSGRRFREMIYPTIKSFIEQEA